MQVEDITGVCLTTTGSAQNQRHLTIGNRLLREVIIDHQGVATSIAEVLTDGSTCKGCKILKRSGVGSGCRNNYGIIHSTLLAQCVYNCSNSRTLLTHSNIDTVNGLTLLICLALVEDGVDSNRCLTCLAVTNNQLTLTTTDRNHRVDSLKAGLQRLVYGLTEDNTRRLTLQGHLAGLTHNLTHTIQRLTQRVDNTTKHTLTHIDRGDTTGTLNGKALLNLVGGTEEHSTYVVLFKVHHHTHHSALKFEQLARLSVAQAVDAGYTIANFKHGAHLIETQVGVYFLELHPQNIGYLTRFYLIGHNNLLTF